MRAILVPVAGRPECERALPIAFDLADRIGASVNGCHMRPHRHADSGYAPDSAESSWNRKTTPSSRAAARSLFEKAAGKSNYPLSKSPRSEPVAIWTEKVGAPGKLMGIVGPLADMIVVSRPKKRGTVADMFLGAALLESGRPVLILPPSGRKSIGRHVCIGWNQTSEGARSVAAVMPLIAAAETVTVVSCGPEDRAGPKSTELVRYLKYYGVKAGRVTTPGRDIEAELTATCNEQGADLLVGGAYSKSRWQQKIFGGTTEWLVHECKLPVLLQHG
ncbi:MAG: universal stress protein [Woeseiaceae bacterium]|jgi:nucleotide-binding universal stress UspA family protein|nr:universal stress protein [Woeseiaceae bacterium]